MNIVLFTPVLEASAIGRMARLVARKLMEYGHHVVIVRTEGTAYFSAASHDFGAEIVAWNDVARVLHICNTSDVLIYQIGDNFEYHQGALEWLPSFPGIVCLHDFYLGHLFHGWSHWHPREGAAVLKAWYGDELATRFFTYQDSHALIEGTCQQAPLTEWICSQASAVVSHSSWGLKRVMAACPGPVYVVPLAYEAPPLPAIDGNASRSRFNVLTFGHINSNKRAASVVRAIGANALLREHVAYRLVGEIEPQMNAELSALANEHGVNLTISGAATQADLAQALADADLVTCLRWPSLEAASASAIEAMRCGKPVIVTDTGFYSEIPDDCVKKIDPQNESDSLLSAMETLYHDPVLRRSLGAAAQQWADANFTADNYVNMLLQVAASASRDHPVIAAANYFTGVLGAWGASDEVLRLGATLQPMRFFDRSASA